MVLKVLGTGSKGNCYLLEHQGKTLVLDCGINFNEIKIGLDFNFLNIEAVLVTHNHKDHSLAVNNFKSVGIEVWQPYLSNKKICSRQFGIYKVTSFDVPHDGVENRGFLIECDGHKLLYATDFEYIKYNFLNNKINDMLIECNYSKEFINLDLPNASHVIKGHAELETTYEFIKNNQTSKLNNVILCHLSDSNSNAEAMTSKISNVFKNNIYVAKKGLLIDLCPFT